MFDTLFKPLSNCLDVLPFFRLTSTYLRNRSSDQFHAAGESAKGHIPHDSHDNSQQSDNRDKNVTWKKKKSTVKENMVTSTREKYQCVKYGLDTKDINEI